MRKFETVEEALEHFEREIEKLEKMLGAMGFEEQLKWISMICSAAGARKARLKIVHRPPRRKAYETGWMDVNTFKGLTLDDRAWADEFFATYREGGSTGQLREGSGPNGAVAMFRAAVVSD